jgi:surface protein
VLCLALATQHIRVSQTGLTGLETQLRLLLTRALTADETSIKINSSFFIFYSLIISVSSANICPSIGILPPYLFYHNKDFNEDIGYWDVSNVKDMSWMFRDAPSFNQDIGNWDTGNIFFIVYSCPTYKKN